MNPTSSGWPSIPKPPGAWRVRPNLEHYDDVRQDFRWEDAARQLEGLPGGRGINIAWETVDRHAHGAGRERTAIRWLGADGHRRDISYEELAAETNRFANVLGRLGVPPREPIFVLTGRIPELVVAGLGALKHRNVVCILDAHLSAEALRGRLALVRAGVLVITSALYQRVVAPIRERLSGLRHVIIVGAMQGAQSALGYGGLMADASTTFEIPPTSPEDPAAIQFTSGTTDAPRAVVHVHRAIVTQHATGTFALDFHDGDIVWCTADPNWAPGACYGVIAALSHGLTTVIDEKEVTAERAYEVLERERVTVWYTTPSAISTLIEAGPELPRLHNLSALRFACSVGERLHPRAVLWGLETFGIPIHDNWLQTETGAILIANFAATPIRPGSMGRPMPGIEAAVVTHSDGGVRLIEQPGLEGELAIRPGWPSMLRGFLDDAARYRSRFAGGWYLTGDLVRRDAEGYYWFIGRAGQAIASGERLLGASEIESAMMSHPLVAEAAVIAQPPKGDDQTAKAFLRLRPGAKTSDELAAELLRFARQQLGQSVVANLAFVNSLPRTRNGQVLHRLLRARELGLPAGDLSTLAERSSAGLPSRAEAMPPTPGR